MAPERILSVAELTRAIKGTVEATFAYPFWIEGEVAGFRAATTGHLYFTLKDEREDAQIDVVIYKSNVTQRVRSFVRDGARLNARGKPTFWSPRGKLQIVVDRVEAAGRGALFEAIEALKQRLLAEGLFAPERKRKLPTNPRIVGVVTSPTGAVIHDVVKVAARRGGAHVLLCPCAVQGDKAPESVTLALRKLEKVQGLDVVIVGRGGGSIDELHEAFSSEAVVRTIARYRVPVVSAVGHETDMTLADLAADARAATPSQAAEMVVPDRAAMRLDAAQRARRLVAAMRARVTEHRTELRDHDLRRLATYAITSRRASLAALSQRVMTNHPRAVLERERADVIAARSRIVALHATDLARKHADLESLAGRLDAMSPLAVLSRGYAIATRDGHAIRSSREVRDGDEINVRVHEGAITARVLRTEEKR